MAQVLGSLPFKKVTQIGFRSPDFDLILPCLPQALGGVNLWIQGLFLFESLPFKKKKKGI